MLMDRDRSQLLVVDVQEKLLPSLHDSAALFTGVAWMADVARELGVPTLTSEQYPKGLGHTVPELREKLAESRFVEKTHFSCAASPKCVEALKEADRPQVVIVGCETHVCVLQTAIGLVEQGYQVFAVADALDSRRPENHELGLARMSDAGVSIVSREMVAFEWLHQAGSDAFRNISRNYLR